MISDAWVRKLFDEGARVSTIAEFGQMTERQVRHALDRTTPGVASEPVPERPKRGESKFVGRPKTKPPVPGHPKPVELPPVKPRRKYSPYARDKGPRMDDLVRVRMRGGIVKWIPKEQK